MNGAVFYTNMVYNLKAMAIDRYHSLLTTSMNS